MQTDTFRVMQDSIDENLPLLSFHDNPRYFNSSLFLATGDWNSRGTKKSHLHSSRDVHCIFRKKYPPTPPILLAPRLAATRNASSVNSIRAQTSSTEEKEKEEEEQRNVAFFRYRLLIPEGANFLPFACLSVEFLAPDWPPSSPLPLPSR